MVVIKVLIFYFNFSGMALDVQASTGRKSMLNSCKNILHNVLDMVNDVKVIFGKGPGSQPVSKDANGHIPMWKKKSIF